jgi:predicted Zn-dependent peptidase
MPARHVQDLMMQLLYGDQPAGWNIAGEKKNILSMERKDFVKYHKEHYVTSATTLVIAGKVKENEVLKEINNMFGSIKSTKKNKKLKVIEKQSKPEILVKYKDTDQTHFVLGVRTYDIFNKNNTILSVLGGVLGAGMSSRLFTKLREEMGVGYYVRAYNDTYTDHGYFQISAGVDNKRIDEVIKAVIEECNKLKNELVSIEELEKVKECLIGNMKLSLESSDDIANFYGSQELLKKEIKTAEQKAIEVRKITSKQIQDMARKIFKNDTLNLAIIGPFKDKNSFTKVLKF